MTRIIDRLDEVSGRYDALFVDLWGCLHNGREAFPAAVSALQRYKAGGGAVVLLTNAPRPREDVEAQLARLEVPRDCWDSIATSGDAARAAMLRGAVGRKVWYMGTEADLTFFEPLHIIEDPVAVERVSLDEAEGIVCTGPFDTHADPAELRPQLLFAKQKGLKLLCANPDLVVDRGEVREYCAGAVARLYEEMGGESLYFGKPQPAIYDLARQRLAEVADVPEHAILCIGDGIATDIRGALGEDLDSLFVTGGLAAAETRTTRDPNPAALSAYLSREMASPTYAMGFLR
ncbi:HAD-superfamily class IIA hydrolase, TIGR01459 [Rhodovulum sp. ES.010]|uniref:TIGR01459 family HAD-type hydrolase n=1 Tax=Rhodovulum sp. ES.010 TaxID=1882821 RepID=UPI00092CA6B4|nr:TIGR01459 family HAD-type hydrolase [Rhodovulum sp. ES.010]SIO45436.1 HAD-superfamily class IIA hydrolase, TIGR01459 [Rhodovulum sp. ES.010]